MILEIADIRIPPGQNDAFDAAIRHGLDTVIAQAKGYRRHRVVRASRLVRSPFTALRPAPRICAAS